jgi:S1-C subfamily serine protease
MVAFSLAARVLGSPSRRTPVVQAVEKALPSVVNIGADRIVRGNYLDPRRRLRGDLFDQMLFEFLGPPKLTVKPSLGSGVIIDPQGYILSNLHVVERAAVIRVTLTDETTYVGHVLASDALSDLALLKIDVPYPLQAVELADDDDLFLGETIIAMGNPFGLAHSVTVGVLSSKDREARYKGEVLYRDILQTDAAVNPGSSGGPLLNIDAELIGINVAIYPDAQNIGFAVPIKRARGLLAVWLAPEALKGIWLGLTAGMQDDELVVASVDAGGPAAAEGVKVGEPIASVNGRAVGSVYAFHKAMLPVAVGEVVELGLLRNGKAEVVPVDVLPVPKPDGQALALEKLGLDFAGTSGDGALGRPVFERGLPIAEVLEGGPAGLVGLRPGQLVTSINGQVIRSLDDVGRALAHLPAGAMVSMQVVTLTESGNFMVAQSTDVQLRAR